ncbi:MAG: aminopeptidase [Betaproteobacteria bacterium]|nr:aminopeptidase [Betaproteobacteria bacterium]
MIRTLFLIAVALALSACASARLAVEDSLGYGWQALRGHLHVLTQARPVKDWLDDPQTPPALRARLALVQEIRAFASSDLGLPDNRSYRSYADLKRPYAVWNVFSAPELSLKLDTWCFPVVGCISYRGYYDQAQAQQFADRLAAQGREVHVGGIPAYSTLGFTPDPVLNTFIGLPDGELARLLFHELAHQVVYVGDDTMFNESFATAVEVAGVERWLATRDVTTRERYAVYAGRRRDFLTLLRAARSSLEGLYRSDDPEDRKRAGKQVLQCQLQTAYQTMRDERWGGYSGYDRFFARPPNNAQLAAVGTYDELVPGFLALLGETEVAGTKTLEPLFERVRALASESRDARRAALAAAVSKAVAADRLVATDITRDTGKPRFDPASTCNSRRL